MFSRISTKFSGTAVGFLRRSLVSGGKCRVALATNCGIDRKYSSKKFEVEPVNINKPFREVRVPEVGDTRERDELVQKIRDCSDAEEVLNLIPNGKEPFSQEALMSALNTLHDLQRTKHLSLPIRDVLEHPKFHTLCVRLKYKARHMDPGDVVDMIKIFNFLGVEPKTEIFLVLLNLLRHQINDLTLDQVAFVDFVLSKMGKVPVVDAIRMALPIVFQTRVNEEIDHENRRQLVEYLRFASHHTEVIKPNAVNGIVTGILLHTDDLTTANLKNIVWDLSRWRHLSQLQTKLLNVCVERLCGFLTELRTADIELLITKFCVQIKSNRNSPYDNVQFLQTAIEELIKRDIGFEGGAYLLMSLAKIRFVSIPLLNYIAEKIDDSPAVLINADKQFVLVIATAFSWANYQPPNWSSTILPAIMKNDSLLLINRYDTRWLNFFSALVPLGYQDLTYVRKVLSAKYLDKYFAVNSKDLDKLQLLHLYQSVACRAENRLEEIDCQSHIDKAIELSLKYAECPLSEFLAVELGQNLVLSRVVSKYGHFMQHVLIRKASTGELLDVDEHRSKTSVTSGNIALDDIQCADDEQIVAINVIHDKFYARNLPQLKGSIADKQKQLEYLGVYSIDIQASAWKELLEHERIPFLMREIWNRIEDRID